ncbi:hypothetical protein GCM10011490_15570 [Pseudoclavibacter endophyticus]|uniref:GNAT family N-acetyltransferase n=1 Tax=Pseudoclavibacter endophyticus TaxID=1778590 RepID=A0A6H9WRV8_9MICO|nr:hypothetical protein [Pseudoclavibacter endophyticus]KAB1649060.1 hypothetical protein F8O04_01895 [Pseudoclavibacter endophyticus]GGA65807.1 hypothetical protein GCM10011490_15570 [Pseudoclavibacter endophyticus]
MYTTDFSVVPAQGQAGAVVLAEGRSSAGRADGVTWRRRLRDGSIAFELLTVATAEQAEAIARSHPARTVVLVAEERGYTNGIWRAEGAEPMAHNEHFHPTSSETRESRTPPRIAAAVRRPRGEAKPSRPRRWTIFDTGSMFLGATRYRHPIAWLVTNRYWWTMTAKMARMSGSVWHGVYWEPPWTLGTLATYRTRDDMLRFARMPEHRHLMQWIVQDTVNANAGFIRLYATREELARQTAEGGGPFAHAEPEEEGRRVSHGGRVGAESPRLHLAPVETEADFQAFLAAPRRGEPEHLAVPLQESSLRSWRERGAPGGEPVELFLARRGDPETGEVVGRTTIHADARLDAKLGTRATLFGATFAATAGDLRDLLSAIERRAGDDGSAELFGPVSLLPNQMGGVITSGFGERGFMDSPWNHEWVPAAYEAAGFVRWHESDSWIARLGGDPASAGVSATDLERAGIRIRRASRIRHRRDVRDLRALTNAAFEQLPYYTEISAEEMRAATDGLIALMDPNLWLFAIDRASGEPVAFVLAVPDITRVLQRSGGRVGVRELLTILRDRMLRGGGRASLGASRGSGADDAREAILLIHGALPSVQGRGIVSLLWRELETGLRNGGYTALRSTVIGRDNPASSRHIERLRGVPLHGHTYFRKRLGGASRRAGGAARGATGSDPESTPEPERTDA